MCICSHQKPFAIKSIFPLSRLSFNHQTFFLCCFLPFDGFLTLQKLLRTRNRGLCGWSAIHQMTSSETRKLPRGAAEKCCWSEFSSLSVIIFAFGRDARTRSDKLMFPSVHHHFQSSTGTAVWIVSERSDISFAGMFHCVFCQIMGFSVNSFWCRWAKGNSRGRCWCRLVY